MASDLRSVSRFVPSLQLDQLDQIDGKVQLLSVTTCPNSCWEAGNGGVLKEELPAGIVSIPEQLSFVAELEFTHGSPCLQYLKNVAHVVEIEKKKLVARPFIVVFVTLAGKVLGAGGIRFDEDRARLAYDGDIPWPFSLQCS